MISRASASQRSLHQIHAASHVQSHLANFALGEALRLRRMASLTVILPMSWKEPAIRPFIADSGSPAS